TMFVLHGNVRDLVPLRCGDHTEFLPLHGFLRRGLFAGRDLVLTYDRGSGVAFAEPAMQQDFRRAIEGYDQFHGSNYAAALARNPGVVPIPIPLPDEDERLEYIGGAGTLAADDEITAGTFAKLTAGLKRVQIQNLMAQSRQNRRPLTLKFLAARKRDLIEAE